MKKILLGTAVPVALALFLGAPYYLGWKAEETLTEQHRVLADTFFFDVVSREYDRGWFSSTETTVIRFHPTLLSNLSKQLPANVKTVLDKEITMVNHVKHGLFADGITPVRASVRTEFRYDPEVQKVLSRFFNNQIPLTVNNTIYLSGGGKLDIKVAPFDYEELSGIKLEWKGMDSKVDYDNGFSRYVTHLDIPGLKAVLADKGDIEIEGVSLRSETRTGKTGMSLGSSDTQLKRFDVSWKENIDYNLKFNELVSAVTDLQIGAFINPTGTIPPSKISVHNLSYQSYTDEKDGFVNAQGRFAFEKLNYGNDQYGPLDIDVSAEHLDGKSLTALKNRWQQISTENLSTEKFQEQMLASVRKEGVGLFTNNPVFKVNKFDLMVPSGHIKVNGGLQFNGLKAADLNDFSSMVQKMKAEINLDVSDKVLESLAVTQARGLFATADSEGETTEEQALLDEEEQKDVDETVRLMMSAMINNLANEGYLIQKNNAIKTSILLENNTVQLNGKPFSIQSDEELLEEIGADEPMSQE